MRHVQYLAQVRQALGLWQAGRGRHRGYGTLRPDPPAHDGSLRVARGFDRTRTSLTCSSGFARNSCRMSFFRSANTPRPRSGRSPASCNCRSTTSRIARRFVSFPTTITCIRPAPARSRPAGPIVDEDGQVLGTHHGIEGFTIGQRRGLGIALGTPRYVVQIEPATRTVTIGRHRVAGAGRLLPLGSTGKQPSRTAPSVAWPRSGPATRPSPRRSSRFPAAGPAFSSTCPRPPSLRQVVTAYQDDMVLGGGWIEGPFVVIINLEEMAVAAAHESEQNSL